MREDLVRDPATMHEVTPRHYRDVLGQFPTGVVVVTAMDDTDKPIGMAVGSFTSVSLDPPLVAFLPDGRSSTFPAIRQAGRFCVNVLADSQEELCRLFATKNIDRFASIDWSPAPHTGSPMLHGSVAWIDCELDTVHDAGDHSIVVGRVRGLEIQTPTLPLLFFQGGYGTFAPRSLVMATRGAPSRAVVAAEEARSDLEVLVEHVGLSCRVVARQDDGLVIVATAGNAGGSDPVGVALPFAAPFGVAIAAWESPEARAIWLGNLSPDLEPAARERFGLDLDRIRERGWSLSFRSEATTAAEGLIQQMARYGRTPQLERETAAAGHDLVRLDDPGMLDASSAGRVRTLSAPVVGSDGPLFHITLYDFPPGATLDFVEKARDRLVAVSQLLTERFGGTLR
jgi:flavin reductase (DIM6/NTAB) family NADH-FMN oxidoreductase RutF